MGREGQQTADRANLDFAERGPRLLRHTADRGPRFLQGTADHAFCGVPRTAVTAAWTAGTLVNAWIHYSLDEFINKSIN